MPAATGGSAKKIAFEHICRFNSRQADNLYRDKYMISNEHPTPYGRRPQTNAAGETAMAGISRFKTQIRKLRLSNTDRG